MLFSFKVLCMNPEISKLKLDLNEYLCKSSINHNHSGKCIEYGLKCAPVYRSFLSMWNLITP